MSSKANESPPEEAEEKVFGNGAVTQNASYDKEKYTSDDAKDTEDTPMPSVDENKNPPTIENDPKAPTQTFDGNSPPSVGEDKNPPTIENHPKAPTQMFAGNSPPSSPSSKRMRTSDEDTPQSEGKDLGNTSRGFEAKKFDTPQSEGKDLGNTSHGFEAKKFYGPSTSNNFGSEPKRRSTENPVEPFDEIGRPKQRKLDRDSKPPGLLSNF